MENIVLIFPGQGSQYVGMGRELYENFDTVRDTFEEANDVLGFDIKRMCFQGNMEELTMTHNTQPSLLTVSVAMFGVYMNIFGVAPAYLAGHSLGEISALTCCGAIKFDDALRIVRQRGIFMQEAALQGTGAMLAITGIDMDSVKEECQKVNMETEVASIACYNSPKQIVISGHISALKKAENSLAQRGARVTPLKVSAPFHCAMMQPAADKLNEELKKYKYSALAWPVVSNVSATPYKSKDQIIEYLTQQMTYPVRWHESMEYVIEHGGEAAVEIGPGEILGNLLKNNFKNFNTYSFDRNEDRERLKGIITSNTKRECESKIMLMAKCLAIAVCVRNRNWNNENYQKGVVEPYERIKRLYEEIMALEKEPSINEVREALDMLKSVFITKNVPVYEQEQRIEQIRLLSKEAGVDRLL